MYLENMINKKLVIKNILTNYYTNSNSVSDDSTLIFLHGWRSEAKAWTSVMNNIEGKFNYFAIDLPGFGNTKNIEGIKNIYDYKNFVKEFIKKLSIKNPILVGHSFGGRVSILLASDDEVDIKQLVLVDSAGFTNGSISKSLIKLAAKLVKPIFKLFKLNKLRKRIYKAIGSEDYVESQELKQIFLETINEDLTEFIKKINCKTLIVWGTLDKATPVSYAHRMNLLIKNSKLELLQNAGHFSFIDEKEKFNELLTSFITEIK
jgi:pimeloyl-ACP methyl ester carboxylesterase